MRTVAVVLLATLLTSRAARGADVDVGLVDQKPPQKKDMVAPKSDEGISVVGLFETITGKMPKDEKRNLYVVVNPLSNPDTANSWWVQQEISQNKDSFSCAAQFGEGSAGVGEYFAVIAVATDKKWSAGEMLTGLPENATYSKVKIVKRK